MWREEDKCTWIGPETRGAAPAQPPGSVGGGGILLFRRMVGSMLDFKKNHSRFEWNQYLFFNRFIIIYIYIL